jgi:hypothetical protein
MGEAGELPLPEVWWCVRELPEGTPIQPNRFRLRSGMGSPPAETERDERSNR